NWSFRIHSSSYSCPFSSCGSFRESFGSIPDDVQSLKCKHVVVASGYGEKTLAAYVLNVLAVKLDLCQLVAPGVWRCSRWQDSQDANVTQAQLSRVVDEARRLRQVSWCVTVVVVSDEPAFLAAFAEWSLKGRLLVWSTRLLVVTRRPLPEVRDLMASHWTFSMMNTMLVILEDALMQPSFFGATVNVTALSYRPYWSEEKNKDSDGTSYSGSDAMLLKTVAHALNITVHVLPAVSWDQVTELVMERVSFMATVYHVVLPQRQLLYDYSYPYEHVFADFTMATPSLTSRWQSLYDPLADEVWASVLVVLFVVPLLLFARRLLNGGTDEVTRPEHEAEFYKRISGGDAAHIAIGTLLAQSVNKRHIVSSASRVLVAAWLVFAFIVGTAYRGNLTAALTLPKYPPRPETLEQLVRVADK
ncbi:Glutamate receptor ionotropic, delta-1-like 14, partial [Homarus americanus]